MRRTSNHSQQGLLREEVLHTGECPKYGHSPHRFVPLGGGMGGSMRKTERKEEDGKRGNTD